MLFLCQHINEMQLHSVKCNQYIFGEGIKQFW